MNFPNGAREILDKMYEKFHDLAHGTEDDRRALTFKIAQTFSAKFQDERWGTKQTTENHPRSKDAIAYKLPNGLLDIWDWQNGTTRQPAPRDGQAPNYPSTPHVFIPTPAFDWLAEVEEEVPPPSGNLEAKIDEILAVVKRIEQVIIDNS